MRWTIIIILLLCLPAVYAMPQVSIDVPEYFTDGQTVKFEYTLSSQTAETVKFAPFIHCDDGLSGLLNIMTIELTPHKTYKATHLDLFVGDNIEPASCHATIEIIEPLHATFSEQFEIRTLPRLKSYVIKSLIKHNIISPGETLSAKPTIPLSARIIYPDGHTEMHDSPLSMSYHDAGTYYMEISAKFTGFKPFTMKKSFAVQEFAPVMRPSLSIAMKKAEIMDLKQSISMIRQNNLVKQVTTVDKIATAE